MASPSDSEDYDDGCFVKIPQNTRHAVQRNIIIPCKFLACHPLYERGLRCVNP
ncbi:MAG: hypothetical protein FWD71_07160 [Oscillospiraceae bacterium]|nr:hypothetical protein [Oscillospiraceae bacterium]